MEKKPLNAVVVDSTAMCSPLNSLKRKERLISGALKPTKSKTMRDKT